MLLLKENEVSWDTNRSPRLNDDYLSARMEQAGYLLLLLHATYLREIPPVEEAYLQVSDSPHNMSQQPRSPGKARRTTRNTKTTCIVVRR